MIFLFSILLCQNPLFETDSRIRLFAQKKGTRKASARCKAHRTKQGCVVAHSIQPYISFLLQNRSFARTDGDL